MKKSKAGIIYTRDKKKTNKDVEINTDNEDMYLTDGSTTSEGMPARANSVFCFATLAQLWQQFQKLGKTWRRNVIYHT